MKKTNNEVDYFNIPTGKLVEECTFPRHEGRI